MLQEDFLSMLTELRRGHSYLLWAPTELNGIGYTFYTTVSRVIIGNEEVICPRLWVIDYLYEILYRIPGNSPPP